MKSQYKIHTDFIIQRHKQGIKLIKPSSDSLDSSQTVGTLFTETFNTYFVNTESAALFLNDQTLKACGWNSNKEIVGRSVVDVWGNTEPMRKIIANDKEVMTLAEIKIDEEDVVCRDSINHTALSIKLPWYNSENNIIGLLGCSLVIGMPGYATLPDFISKLVNRNFLSSSAMPGLQIDDIYFSKREKEIMLLMLQGKTAKKIALLFGTSYRTVEHQIENIKIKLNVHSKSELIEKLFERLTHATTQQKIKIL